MAQYIDPETTSGKLRALLNALEEKPFTDWEISFLENMEKKLIIAEENQLTEAETLTEKQAEKIDELWQRYLGDGD